MPAAGPHVKHPYVTRKPGVCGGEPIIRGTRFPVRSVVVYVLHLGMAPEEVVRDWPHLRLAHIYDALSYYHDNQAAIDRSIRGNLDAERKARASG